MKTHLDLIKNDIPKYPICVPSCGRPTGHTLQALMCAGLNAYIYIDETDPVDDYKQTGLNIVVGPKRNIAEKRYDIVKHQLAIGNKWIWCIDDDFHKFQTKDLNAKYIDIGIHGIFSTAEQFINVNKDWFCKIPAGNIGLCMFGKNKKYIFNMNKPAIDSKRTLFAGCYGLNIGLMEKAGINFDRDCPAGCGEDVELVARFITNKLYGKTIPFIEAVYDKKIKSQAWDVNIEIEGLANKSQKHKDSYIYLKSKYPRLIYWDPKGKMGAVVHKTEIEYPDWYVKEVSPNKKFAFGGIVVNDY